LLETYLQDTGQSTLKIESAPGVVSVSEATSVPAASSVSKGMGSLFRRRSHLLLPRQRLFTRRRRPLDGTRSYGIISFEATAKSTRLTRDAQNRMFTGNQPLHIEKRLLRPNDGWSARMPHRLEASQWRQSLCPVMIGGASHQHFDRHTGYWRVDHSEAFNIKFIKLPSPLWRTDGACDQILYLVCLVKRLSTLVHSLECSTRTFGSTPANFHLCPPLVENGINPSLLLMDDEPDSIMSDRETLVIKRT
jgi:hypothetical protein